MKIRSVQSSLIALVALCNVHCVKVDSEVPRVCVSESEVVIPLPIDQLAPENLAALGLSGDATVEDGLDALGATNLDVLALIPTVSVEQSFTASGLDALPNLFRDFGADGRVSLLDASIASAPGALAGLERLVVALAPEPGEPPVELAVCDVSDGCDVLAEPLALQTNQDQDLLPLLDQDEPELTIEMVARPTALEWTVDVDLCMAASISIVVSP